MGARTILRFVTISGLCIFPYGCTGARSHKTPPRASKGVLDLRDWDRMRDGAVSLAGEFEFYWQQQLWPEAFSDTVTRPEPHFIEVEKPWNDFKISGKKLGGDGFATYRLTLLLNSERLPLAFHFPDMGTAFRVFLNGEQLIEIGRPGKSRATTIPKYRPLVVEFDGDSTKIELIYHVSNFHHARGGAWERVRLGTKWEVYKVRGRRLAYDLVLFGTILVMGLYHLAFLTLRRRAKPALFFGLLCLIVAVRLLTVNERTLLQYFPALSWEVFLKIEYLTYYLSVPAFGLFFASVFRQDFSRFVLRAVLGVGLSAAGLVLLFPAKIFTHTMIWFNLFTLAALAYALYFLFLCAKRGRRGARTVLFGFLLLGACVLNDILDANAIIHTGHLTQLGVSLFIFAQAFLIAVRFARAFDTVELQRSELVVANDKYKVELAERQRAEHEKEELQEKLARSQKMEALGLLAGGVAHDLNNILAGTVTYPDLLLLDLAEESPLREPLETIKQSGIKAADIVQDLLTLARRGVLNPQPVNLNDIISDYLASPESEALKLDHPGLDIVAGLEPELCTVEGSAIHIRTVVMNLVANAAESNPSDDKVWISTRNCHVDKTINGYEYVSKGDFAVVKVEDHGCGIAQEDIGKVFEPFYTQKIMGRSGTGLGMAVVWGTVHDHHGFIDVRSSVGNGSTFDLYFPITEAALVKPSRSTPVEAYSGDETILIVDDAELQRRIATRILTKLGYQTISVASGEEAVAYVRDHPVDLLLLDMIMEPGIDGLETYEAIQEVRPGTKAVIASGFSETDRVRQAQKLGAGKYIRKPYTIEGIGLAVRNELDRIA